MINIKEMWNNWINNIKQSDNEQYITQIKELKKDYKTLGVHYRELNDSYESLFFKNDDLINELYELTNIEFKAKNTYYNWRGKGSERIHLALNNFSKDTEYIEKYIVFLEQELKLKATYKTEDDLIYDLVKKIHKFVDNRYTKDKTEYWYTPQEAFEVYVLGNSGDCDDLRAFMWGCIVSALIMYGWDNSLNRLLAVDISLPFGHAVNAWKKDNGIWALIESTAYEDRFVLNWNRNCNIFKSIYTSIWHIFDEKTEYTL